MKNYLTQIAFLYFVTISFSGCSKEKIQPKDSITSLITVTPWNLNSILIDPGIDTDGDGELEYELHADRGQKCNLDNLEVFHKNYLHTLEEGATKCYQGSPNILYSGKWSFIKNDTKLIKPWNSQVPADTLHIISLQKTSMTLQGQDIRNGISYTYTYKYIR